MSYNPESLNDRAELAKALREMLATAKFKLENAGGSWEEVYSFNTPNPKIRILVFSTIAGNSVRESGKDAIRVCAVYLARDGIERGIVKETRVNRTGKIAAITQRTLERMRDAYRSAGHQVCCEKCGAPKFVSKSGNLVCAEICWKKDLVRT